MKIDYRYSSNLYKISSHAIIQSLEDWIVERKPNLKNLMTDIQKKISSKNRADIWRERLLINYIVRALQTKAESTQLLTEKHLLNLYNENSLLAATQFQFGDCNITLAAKSTIIDSDLLAAWHPELEGSNIEAITWSSDLTAHLNIIGSALKLISAHVPSEALVSNNCRAISLIDTNPPLKQGQCVSLCSKSVPGLIFISKAPTILTAESIVHETAHQLLYAIDECDKLILDDSTRLITPLRPDPRPMSGLFHQVWVLWHLKRFYNEISQLDNNVILLNHDKILKRLQQHEKDYSEGISVIQDNSNILSAEGKLLLEEILDQD